MRASKREQVRVAFAQRGMAADVEPTVVIAGGRRRAVFAARRRGSGVVLGFHAARGHEIVGLAECPVLVPEIVAALPALVGLSGDDYLDPTAMTSGFRASMMICAVLLTIGGVVSWFGLARTSPRVPEAAV